MIMLRTDEPERAAKMEAAWKTWAKRAFVDDWPGPDHTNWGQDIKVEAKGK